MRFSLAKATTCILLLLGAGCRYFDVARNADGSWKATYYSYGLWTSIGYLEVDVPTNGVVHLKMSDLGTDMSTNHVTVVDSSGKVVAEITGEVVERIVK